MNYRSIITKLEFKAMLYATGLTKTAIVDIISMQDYFSITYINGMNQVVRTEIEKNDLYGIIHNHSKALLMLN